MDENKWNVNYVAVKKVNKECLKEFLTKTLIEKNERKKIIFINATLLKFLGMHNATAKQKQWTVCLWGVLEKTI